MRLNNRVRLVITLVLAAWVLVRGLVEGIRRGKQGVTSAEPRKQRSSRTDVGPPPSPERRRLLALIAMGGAGTGAVIVGMPVVGFIVAPAFREVEREWQAVGRVDDFPEGEVRQVEFLNAAPLAWSGPAAQSASWLWRRGPEDFVAYKVNCTHLGCPVRWEEGAQFFMCPCHGGVFHLDGEVAAGPPKKPLEHYATRVRDGMVEVRTGPIPLTGDVLLSD